MNCASIVPAMYWKYGNERHTLSLKSFTNKWTDNENIINKPYYRGKEAGSRKKSGLERSQERLSEWHFSWVLKNKLIGEGRERCSIRKEKLVQNDGHTKNRVDLGNLKEFSLIREWGYMGEKHLLWGKAWADWLNSTLSLSSLAAKWSFAQQTVSM